MSAPSVNPRKVGDRCAAQTGSVRHADAGCRGRVVVQKVRYRPTADARLVDKLSLCCDLVGHAWGVPTADDLAVAR